ncbi:hypothetical protein GCM10027598_20170 [Amycolatopsis oliviviridis]|uniref:Uncharacterized protein n=1 Tax=Amycolatopsis oliviviridis TaxID=1471590 RepID=A0ABQ3LL35_9PSEU|nr:hypothetical protein GCM10017790_27820 [Amycolatopsis oliviviridis]
MVTVRLLVKVRGLGRQGRTRRDTGDPGTQGCRETGGIQPCRAVVHPDEATRSRSMVRRRQKEPPMTGKAAATDLITSPMLPQAGLRGLFRRAPSHSLDQPLSPERRPGAHARACADTMGA